jgi:hypothetical protein
MDKPKAELFRRSRDNRRIGEPGPPQVLARHYLNNLSSGQRSDYYIEYLGNDYQGEDVKKLLTMNE